METSERAAVVCPWVCLIQNSILAANPSSSKAQEPVKKPSYAEIAKDRMERTVDLSHLPIPTLRGNTPVIKIAGKSVDNGLNYFKFALVTRIDSKGRNMDCIKAGIADLWSEMGVKVSPLGRGYLLARFDAEVDYKKVKFGGPWYYGKQLLRVSDWTPNFNVVNQKHSNAEIWVKFPGLSLEYWELDILMAMARTVGTPIHVDRNTLRRDHGYYANVLVDMDLSKRAPDRILVEVEEKGLEFWQEIQLGPLPDFCNNCKVVGHVTAGCRFLSVVNKEGVEVQKNGEKSTNIVVNMKRKKKREKKKNKGVGISNAIPVESESEEEEEDNNENTDIGTEELLESMQNDVVAELVVEMGKHPENTDLLQNNEHGVMRVDQNQNGNDLSDIVINRGNDMSFELDQDVEAMQKEDQGLVLEGSLELLIVHDQEVVRPDISSVPPINEVLNDHLAVDLGADSSLDPIRELYSIDEESVVPESQKELVQEVDSVLGMVVGNVEEEICDVQEDLPDLDQALDNALGLDSLIDNLTVDDEVLVPESQLELVREAGIVAKLLEKGATKNKQGDVLKGRRLLAKFSKKNIGTLPPGPLKERLEAMNTNSSINGGGTQ